MNDDVGLLQELRSALSHLEDPSYLEGHPLTRRIGFVAEADDLSKGQALRRALRLAIEALDPGPKVPPSSPEGRPYEVISRHYVSKRSIVAVAAELDISERQAYRELRRGTEALLQIVAQLVDQPREAQNTGMAAPAVRVLTEIERISSSDLQQVDLRKMVEEAVTSARRLARTRGVEIVFASERGQLEVTCNRVMLRQAILNLLSHIVSVHEGQRVTVSVTRSREHAHLRFSFPPGASRDLAGRGDPYQVATQLANSLGIRWEQRATRRGEQSIVTSIPLSGRRPAKVLIVDDNAGVVALFRRYLRQQPYQVHGVQSVPEALEALPRIRPDVILLDVMMPEQDGWELLEALQGRESEGRARVIVCSVIKDPDLAAALGADGFLHKPVDRAQLLQALRDVVASTA